MAITRALLASGLKPLTTTLTCMRRGTAELVRGERLRRPQRNQMRQPKQNRKREDDGD
jgi:hypothetical protein